MYYKIRNSETEEAMETLAKLPDNLKDWLTSEEGQLTLKECAEMAEKLNEKMKRAQRVDITPFLDGLP